MLSDGVGAAENKHGGFATKMATRACVLMYINTNEEMCVCVGVRVSMYVCTYVYGCVENGIILEIM